MFDFLKTYKARPWPRLEVPPMKRTNLLALVLLTGGLIAAGWYIWFSGTIQVEYFIALGLVIPLAFILKSRFIALIGLLSFQGNSDYAILPVVILIGAIIAFESPMVMYVFLIFVVWFDKSFFLSDIRVRYEFIVGIGLLLGWIFNRVLKQQGIVTIAKSKTKWPAGLFLIWALFGFVFWCPEPLYSGWNQVKFIITDITFFIITPLIIHNEKRLRVVIWAWIVVGLIAGLATIMAPMLGYQPEISSWGGGSGTFSWHKNISGSFLCFSFFITYAWYRRRHNSLIKSILFLFAVITVLSLVKLQSKSAMIAFLISFIIFVFMDNFLNRRKIQILVKFAIIFLVVSIALLVLVSVYVLEYQQYLGVYGTVFENPLESPTFQIRLLLWGTAWNIITSQNHIFRGLGPGAFWVYGIDLLPLGPFITEDTVKSSVLTGEDLYLQTHNLYIDLFLHYGIVGFILIGWLILNILLNLWKRFRRSANPEDSYLFLGMLCAIFAFLIHAFFDFSMFNIARFWMFMGLCVAAINVLKKIETTL